VSLEFGCGCLQLLQDHPEHGNNQIFSGCTATALVMSEADEDGYRSMYFANLGGEWSGIIKLGCGGGPIHHLCNNLVGL